MKVHTGNGFVKTLTYVHRSYSKVISHLYVLHEHIAYKCILLYKYNILEATSKNVITYT